jgi:ATP-binding cassette subfamily F protein uup
LRKSSKGFKYYDQWREEIIEGEEAALRKMNRKLEAEKGWLNAGVTGKKKAKSKKVGQFTPASRVIQGASISLAGAQRLELQIELAEEMQKTKFIIEAENISYNFPGKKLFDNFTFKVKKGEKIGVIGPNGIGKSTFIKILIKEIEPELGKVKHGTNLEITYFDQYRSELNPAHSLKQTLLPNRWRSGVS